MHYGSFSNHALSTPGWLYTYEKPWHGKVQFEENASNHIGAKVSPSPLRGSGGLSNAGKLKSAWTAKVPKPMAQHPQIESIGIMRSIILGIFGAPGGRACSLRLSAIPGQVAAKLQKEAGL